MRHIKSLNSYMLLAVLFAAGLLFTIVFGFFYSAVASAIAKPNDAPAPPAVARRSTEQLELVVQRALNPETGEMETAGNPFADKAGLSLKSGSPQASSPAGGAVIPGAMAPQGTMPNAPFSRYGQPMSPMPMPTPPVRPYVQGQQMPPPMPNALPEKPTVQTAAEINSRLTERDRNLRGGQPGVPVSEIYNIDDVRPLGVVGTKTRREILFYSPVTKQTFAAPQGQRFRDGRFETVTDGGVVFERDGSSQSIVKRWTRSGAADDAADTEAPLVRDVPKPKTARNNPN